MTSRRVLKAAEAIREVVSTAILMEIKDPRIQDVTVTYVEVSPDMRNAKVHVSVMGNEAKQKLSLHGLQSAAGFLQSKIAQRIDTRYTPRLQFLLDKGVKHSIEVSRILSDLFPAKTAAAEDTGEQDTGEQDTGEQDESTADDEDASDVGADAPDSESN
jgi:ribosome-binding factor A